jgi:hypothetical protein
MEEPIVEEKPIVETVSIQVPAFLYTSLYERYGEETTSTITTLLSHFVNAEPQIEGVVTQYPRPRAGTITGRVWEIADRIQRQSGKAGREAVIKACMSEGINSATASTQYSHWKKANL